MKIAIKISKLCTLSLLLLLALILSISFVSAIYTPGRGECGDGECDPADGEDGCTCSRDCGVCAKMS